MRNRIIRAFAAVAAAGVALSTAAVTAASSAGAATVRPGAASAQPGSAAQHTVTTRPGLGPTVSTVNMAGYQATGRDFRYIQALITVPDWRPRFFQPHAYIQLAGVDQWVRIGVTHRKGHWMTFIAARNNGLFPVQYYLPRHGLQPGDGVFFSIYFDQAGNELHFVIIPPSTSGPPDYFKTRARGPLFTEADALDDWTYTSGRPAPLPPFVNHFRINQFFQGAITTYSGVRGSFVGPWTTSKVVATSNGEPFPQGHVRVSPGYLWSDGLVANGAVRPLDTFGVWARH